MSRKSSFYIKRNILNVQNLISPFREQFHSSELGTVRSSGSGTVPFLGFDNGPIPLIEQVCMGTCSLPHIAPVTYKMQPAPVIPCAFTKWEKVLQQTVPVVDNLLLIPNNVALPLQRMLAVLPCQAMSIATASQDIVLIWETSVGYPLSKESSPPAILVFQITRLKSV